jgi:Flp pilus assembly protein TadG
MGPRPGGGERGSTSIEASLIVALLFALLFGLFDLGHWEFQLTQLTAAARDGTRAGIVSYASATGTTASPGGADFSRIDDAVRARLVGQPYALAVSCVGPTDDSDKPCDAAAAGVDRLRTQVTWTRSGLTPITAAFGPRTITGSSVMVLT